MNVHTITLGFAPARILRASLANHAATRNQDLQHHHYYLDQHYPLDRERNRDECLEVCREHGVTVFDAGRNLGLHVGFNFVLNRIGAAPGDIIIAFDPDMYPTAPGWDMALVRAIRGDPLQRAVWASLVHPNALKEINGQYEERVADGYIRLWKAQRAVENSLCAWSYDWLQKCGGLSEPCAFYGHLEAAMRDQLGNKDWVHLPDWCDTYFLRDQQDQEYAAYKWAHAHSQTWPGDFASWLAAGKPV